MTSNDFPIWKASSWIKDLLVNLVVKALDKFRAACSPTPLSHECAETKSGVSAATTPSLNEKRWHVSSQASASDSDWDNVSVNHNRDDGLEEKTESIEAREEVDKVDIAANDLIDEYDSYFGPTVQIEHIAYLL